MSDADLEAALGNVQAPFILGLAETGGEVSKIERELGITAPSTPSDDKTVIPGVGEFVLFHDAVRDLAANGGLKDGLKEGHVTPGVVAAMPLIEKVIAAGKALADKYEDRDSALQVQLKIGIVEDELKQIELAKSLM